MIHKHHFAKFAIALTLLFVIGIVFLFAINLHDNAKTGQNKTLTERISDIMGK
ncbi:MAG: hypothetical protein KA028_02685 [Candidatus Pacebacteria bacterium]|nr:hypothetical protein [Candidatus Paceibacterota bacterium]MBP9852045.1 hypothetical protein [Candidatus Paceibacterota bacterium]